MRSEEMQWKEEQKTLLVCALRIDREGNENAEKSGNRKQEVGKHQLRPRLPAVSLLLLTCWS